MKTTFPPKQQKVILTWLRLGNHFLSEEEKLILNGVIEELRNELWQEVYSSTEFYDWRERLKIKCINLTQNRIITQNERFVKQARNCLILQAIDGNPMWELIYDWARFQRVVDSSSSHFFSEAKKVEENGLLTDQQIRAIRYQEFQIIHDYLIQKGFDKEKLWNDLHAHKNLNQFHMPQSIYEIITKLYKSEINWPIEVLYEVLQNFNLDGDSIMHLARIIEKSAKESIRILQMESQNAQKLMYIQNKYFTNEDSTILQLRLTNHSTYQYSNK